MGKKRKTAEYFIKSAKKVHGDKYDYSLTEYINNRTKVEIICPEHGSFWQKPSNHVGSSSGCPECSGRRSLTKSGTEWFIEKSRVVHGDKYDYSKTKYTTSEDYVNIICRHHGEFLQCAQSHIKGSGCPKCAYHNLSLKNRATRKDFIEKAREVHGWKYRYSKVNYINSNKPVEIICKEHGSFWQTPRSHVISGAGCTACYRDRQKVNRHPNQLYGIAGYYGTCKPSNLYICLINDAFIKIGVAKNIDIRMKTIARETGCKTQVLYSVNGIANELFAVEQDLLFRSGIERYKPEIKFDGMSECFEKKHLDTLIELIKHKLKI